MNGGFPKISIITVALNSASTIEDCLNSVKKQLLPVQHIIIYGSSTDNTQIRDLFFAVVFFWSLDQFGF